MKTMTEIYGEPNTGKTHLAHVGWPDPLHIDTAFVQMGFRSFDVESGSEGESYPVVAKLHDWDEDETDDHYWYVDSYSGVTNAIELTDRSTIVIDNSADLRALAARHWCEENGKEWPQREQWGEVNNLVDEAIRAASDKAHVVVVSQMDDEYKNGEKTGNREWDGPKRVDYRADFRLKLELQDGDRIVNVVKNRHLDSASDDLGAKGTDLGSNTDLEELLMLSGIPEDRWDL